MSKPRMCPNCRAFVDPKEKICPYCDNPLGETYAKRAARQGGGFGGIIPDTHVTTFIILFVNLAMFVAMLLLSQKLGMASLFSIDGRVAELFGAKVRYNILVEHQWWRLATAGFLHAGLFHFGMNSWVLFDLGAAAEYTYGTSRYLVIYFVSNVFGFWASLFWTPAQSLGASAALCGLIGALMAGAKRTGQSMAWSFYMRWMIIIVVLGLIVPYIDQAAHLGGFVAGYAVGWIASSPRVNRNIESLWKAAATLATLGTVAALAIAYSNVLRAL
ncbi:MAG: rhomboid family intramembrane serine protease [Acidobacteria bacterium]|nr:rhomboid family intramembrane serine protease [Acidobacteriota bacterium]